MVITALFVAGVATEKSLSILVQICILKTKCANSHVMLLTSASSVCTTRRAKKKKKSRGKHCLLRSVGTACCYYYVYFTLLETVICLLQKVNLTFSFVIPCRYTLLLDATNVPSSTVTIVGGASVEIELSAVTVADMPAQDIAVENVINNTANTAEPSNEAASTVSSMLHKKER